MTFRNLNLEIDSCSVIIEETINMRIEPEMVISYMDADMRNIRFSIVIPFAYFNLKNDFLKKKKG